MAVPGEVLDRSALTEARTAVGEVDAYVVQAAGDRARGGIIVIHEAFGPVEHIDDIARRFAAAGFDTIAPDLYTREGAPTAADMSDVRPKMFGVPDARAVADLDAAAGHLRSLPHSNGRVGCIGFCSGGRQTLLFALSSAAVDAAAPCWGGFIDRATPDDETTDARPTAVWDLTDGLQCPLYVVGGAEDANPSPEVLAELGRRLAGAAHPVEVEVFADAGHAFLADYRDGYVEAAAFDLWPKLVAFFDHHLS